MGKLTLTVFLALCPAMGSTFVVRALGSTPVDSPRKRQASASLGAPLGIGRRLGADGALSRAGCNDGEDYAAWCSRSNCPLHGSKGVEVRAYTFKRCLPRPHRQAQSLLSSQTMDHMKQNWYTWYELNRIIRTPTLQKLSQTRSTAVVLRVRRTHNT